MENNSENLVVAVAGYTDRMNRFFLCIPWMMIQTENNIDFTNYTSEKLVKIVGVMSRDLEHNIDKVAYKSFHIYITARTELSFFSNTRTVTNTVDRARMNLAIRA